MLMHFVNKFIEDKVPINLLSKSVCYVLLVSFDFNKIIHWEITSNPYCTTPMFSTSFPGFFRLKEERSPRKEVAMFQHILLRFVYFFYI